MEPESGIINTAIQYSNNHKADNSPE